MKAAAKTRPMTSSSNDYGASTTGGRAGAATYQILEEDWAAPPPNQALFIRLNSARIYINRRTEALMIHSTLRHTTLAFWRWITAITGITITKSCLIY